MMKPVASEIPPYERKIINTYQHAVVKRLTVAYVRIFRIKLGSCAAQAVWHSPTTEPGAVSELSWSWRAVLEEQGRLHASAAALPSLPSPAA